MASGTVNLICDSTMQQDPQTTINEVVNSVKSEGLFDQFRKECLEEFENMETYFQLKQTVENHVASFLARHKFHGGLQKNSLRNELRSHISRSEVLLNGIQQLVDEVLSRKGHSFCLKIDKQVDNFLNPEPVNNPSVLLGESSSQVLNDDVETLAFNEPETSKTAGEPVVYSASDEMVLENVSPIDENDGEKKSHLNIENISGDEENVVTEIEQIEMEVDETLDSKERDHDTPQNTANIDEENIVEKSLKDSYINRNIGKVNVTDLETAALQSIRLQTDSRTEKPSLVKEQPGMITNNTEHESAVIPESTENDVDVETRIIDTISGDDVDSIVVATQKCKPDEEKCSEKDQTDSDRVEPSTNPSLYYAGLQTEPISDDSTTNSFDSTSDRISEASETTEDGKHSNDNDEPAVRKSKRVRNLPLKYRKEKDDTKACGNDSDKDCDNKKRVKVREKTHEIETETRFESVRGRLVDKDKNKRSSSSNTRKRSTSNSNVNKHSSSSHVTKGRRTDSPTERTPRSRDMNTRTSDSRDKNAHTSESRDKIVHTSESRDKSSRSSSRNTKMSDSRSSNTRSSNNSSPDMNSSKRSRRPTKQRERYSPTL